MYQYYSDLLKKLAKYFLAVLFIFSNTPSTSTETSTRSADILCQFTAKMKSIPAFEMNFSMVLDGSKIEGVVQSQKESFKLTNSQLELYCDGVTKWVYNIDNKELTIMTNDPSQTDLTENPLAFLSSLEKGYNYSDKARSGSAGGKPIWLIELKPLNKRLAYTSITIGIEKGTLRPVSVQYLSKNGAKHTATITIFTEKSPWPANHFTFPASRMSGINVTDLR
ncbi:MAG: outer membrane lipoprotein carrier protein LolA [Bacteroidales bacterium]